MFRTELTIAPQERLLPRTARVLTVGSCFADSIGERLRLNKVNALVNPFGTVFQPLALAQLLRAAAGEAQDWQQHVVEARGRWQSYDFHSTIGADSPVELLQIIQETVSRVGEFVRSADAVVLTLGTAWAYRLRETGELVSNLHKLPASLFEKELLTADEIVNSMAEVHALLRRLNPNIRIVLTVSPVRHIKDTLPLNAVSKSVLRVACHYLSELLPSVSYFPAYELLTDDLRDYRFYAADMLHPSEVAEDYIWERFARAYFDADFGRFRKEWAAVRQSLSHRPLHIGAPEHRTFLEQTLERLERLVSQGVEVRQELRDVQRQLVALPPPRPTRVIEAEPEDDGEERIDIGDGTPTVAASETDVQPDRRNDRNNRRDGRDNRRNDRNNRDRRDNRSAPATTPVAEEPVLPTEETVEESVATSAEALLASPEAELLLPAAEETDAYPAKKKKRRSRGGAKRTARKNAARLAGEQGDAALVEGEDETDEPEAATESVEVSGADAVFSAPFSLAELPVADVAPSDTADFEAETDQPETDETELLADANSAATEQPATVRRRGTGPTPKKSKVITKSGLVKRGQRGSLYRTPTPAPEETGTPALETAPIISSPIIPEVLLERPANNLASPPEPAAEPDLAATVLGLYVSKPKASAAATQPKRGRPKAAATNSASTEAAPATTVAPVTSVITAPAPTAAAAATPVASEAAPVEAVPAAAAVEPATVEAAPTEAAPTKATAKAKKPAPRSDKAKGAKPAAAKKPAATKPATAKKTAAATTARRGRPPGKKAAPDAPDTPAA